MNINQSSEQPEDAAASRPHPDHPAAEPSAPKDSRKPLVLVTMEPDESFGAFKARVIQKLKEAGVLKADGTSNLKSDGAFIQPPKNTQYEYR